MRPEDLEEIGLNRSESKAYLALLELGSASAGAITDKSQVSPSKIYGVLERLLKKGLASYILKAKTRYYSPASPEKLKDYLEKEQEMVLRRGERLSAMLPALKRFQKASEDHQEAEIFVGFPAMKNAYHTMYDRAKKGDTHLVFLRSEKEESKPEAVLFFNRLHKKAVEMGLSRRLLSRDTPVDRELYTRGAYSERKGDEVRFAGICPEGVNIINDQVLFMHLAERPICVLITSRQMAGDYRQLFEEIWSIAKK
jgi:sugar-specific transcriptional regulator TrmB